MRFVVLRVVFAFDPPVDFLLAVDFARLVVVFAFAFGFDDLEADLALVFALGLRRPGRSST